MPVRSLFPALVVAVALQAVQNQRPTFRTEANYVRVDVYATKDGVPLSDLTAADFEVLEDRVPQKIDAFQHIVIRGNVPQEARREPNTLRESRTMLEDPNVRVFVLFLDVNHVEVEASHRIRQPLIDALNRVIGADDLIGVMTPEMSAGDITFARKTTTIEGILSRYWTWGERERLNSRDPVEDQYRACYPGFGPTPACRDDDRGVYAEMIERRREKQTVDALEDLVRFLRGVREERKAVIAVTDGWRLFRPDPALARQLYCQVPRADVYIDPRSGKPATKAPPGPVGTSSDVCERDRMMLAAIDDDEQFRRILDEANRANTSFYPVDPRGLVVFDTPIVPVNGPTLAGPASPVPPAVDRAMLANRLTSLRTLADATDGVAIVDSNSIGSGLTRAVDDLSSYYLLGYYSTGKLDGKFHSISVRVKRPGIQVRARRGYLAATAGDVTRATELTGRAPAPPEAAAEALAIEAVLRPLDGYSRDVPLRVQAAAGWKGGTPPVPVVWLVGEIGGSAAEDWKSGAEVDITMSAPDGAPIAGARATVPAGGRMFRAVLAPATTATPGEYTIGIRARASASGSSPSHDTLRVALPPAPQASGAIVIRRGQSTGNRDVPTADLRFRRNEQIRIEVPAPDAASVAARLLDRTGRPLTIPVAAALRDDAEGVKWATAQVSLAPLAPGDYVVELSTTASGSGAPVGSLVGFRIVP